MACFRKLGIKPGFSVLILYASNCLAKQLCYTGQMSLLPCVYVFTGAGTAAYWFPKLAPQ